VRELISIKFSIRSAESWRIRGLSLGHPETEGAPMFEIDTETFNTLWPSLIVVACMIGVMGWAVVKALGLINQDARKETNRHRMNH